MTSLNINLNNSPVYVALMIIASLLSYLLISIFFIGPYYSFPVLVFYNQKIKNEGFGVEYMAESIIAPVEANIESQNQVNPAMDLAENTDQIIKDKQI
jgi:hypothetical protein